MTGPTIAWRSSDTAVARISTTGLLSARAPGGISVSATADGVSGAASIKVLVAASTVVITPDSVWIDEGTNVQLTAVVNDSMGRTISGRPVTWASGDPAKVVVSQLGIARGIAAADVQVTARVETAVGTALVRVRGPVASVTVLPAHDTLVIGDSIQLTATPKDAAGHLRYDRPVSWRSMDYQATVRDDGMVVGVAAGAATLYATSDGVVGAAGVAAFMDTVPVTLQATTGRTCAVSAHRIIYCWGDITFPVPGLTDGNQISGIPAAVRLPTDLRPVVLAVAPAHTCMLVEDGSAYCVGANISGQLGNDTLSHQCTGGFICAPLPVPVLGGLTFMTIAGGYYDTCGITSSGSGYCWGGNVRGEIGDSSTTVRMVPTLVHGGLQFRSISVGDTHTCALTTDSLAYCWGDNRSGVLGIGTVDDVPHTTPEPVAGHTKFVSIGAGAGHNCGLTAGGVAYCWGANDQGQLGVGTSPTGCDPTDCSSPVPITGISFASLSVGQSHTCGVTSQGFGYCWGLGNSNQLGDGSGVSMATPRLVLGGINWKSISAGAIHTCGISVQHIGYCWGNARLALGTGDGNGQDRPTRFLGQR